MAVSIYRTVAHPAKSYARDKPVWGLKTRDERISKGLMLCYDTHRKTYALGLQALRTFNVQGILVPDDLDKWSEK